MLELKDQCIHPTSQKPYIRSFTGGKNNSPEGQAVCIPKHQPTRLLTLLGQLNPWLRC